MTEWPPPEHVLPPSGVAPRQPGRRVRVSVGAALATVVVLLVGGGIWLVGVRGADGGTRESRETGDPQAKSPKSPRASEHKEATASPTYPGVSVDVEEAASVARQLWNGMVTARHENDRDALRALLKGPALEATLGDMCDCPGIPKFVAETFSVNVPRQTSWPAVFFASATYTSSCEASARPCVDSFVAVQDRERGPWKIALWVGYSGRLNAETSGVGPGSFALDPPPLTYRDAVTLPAEYAEYRDSLKRTGEPPPQTRLGPGPFTTGEAEWLYDPPAEQRARNLSEGTSYTVGGDPMYAFTAVAETAVVCGTVRYTSVATALPGMTIRQSQEQTEWGTKLAPGRYSSIVAEGLHMVCFELYANPNVPVTVFGRYGSVTKVTGTRAD